MTTFRYRALTPNGEVASGSISAPTAAEVSQRVEYLGLIPIETVRDEGGTGGARWDFTILSRPRPEDVTVFTGDLAPLLQTGARINDASNYCPPTRISAGCGQRPPSSPRPFSRAKVSPMRWPAMARPPHAGQYIGGARRRTGPRRGAAPALHRCLLSLLSGTIRSSASGRMVQLPRDVTFHAILADQCGGRASGAAIQFLPSGMSCGGTIFLARPGVETSITLLHCVYERGF